MRSWDSRKASAGVAATTDGGRTESGSVGQPLVSRSPAIEPARSSARAWSTENGGSQTPNPVVALPWGSRSITRVSTPRDQALAASPSAIVVLPTPPFWLTTATTGTAATVAAGRRACGGRVEATVAAQAAWERVATRTMSSSASTRWGLASNRPGPPGMPTACRDLPRESGPNPCRGDAADGPIDVGVCCGDAHACHGLDVPVGEVHEGTADEVESVAQCFGSDPRVVHLSPLPELRGSRREDHRGAEASIGNARPWRGPMVRNAVRGMVDSRAKRAIHRAKRAFRSANRAISAAGREARRAGQQAALGRGSSRLGRRRGEPRASRAPLESVSRLDRPRCVRARGRPTSQH